MNQRSAFAKVGVVGSNPVVRSAKSGPPTNLTRKNADRQPRGSFQLSRLVTLLVTLELETSLARAEPADGMCSRRSHSMWVESADRPPWHLCFGDLESS